MYLLEKEQIVYMYEGNRKEQTFKTFQIEK